VNSTLLRCLNDLEERIDSDEETRLHREWTDFAEGSHGEGVFAPRRAKVRPPRTEWPKVGINDALEDFDLMALHQYRLCSDLLASGGGNLLQVRANYGTPIIPSLFGAKLFVMPREADTLPANWPLGEDGVLRLLDHGVPDVLGALGGCALGMGAHFREIGADWPKIGQFVQIYHPDAQGPMDLCELLWGSTLFCALIEKPDRVRALLELVTQTYYEFLQAWQGVCPFHPGCNPHWGMLVKGAIFLREDSCMNLSPGMVREFVVPHDQRLLREFGGGAVHFCGHGDHFVDLLTAMDGVSAVNISQPELNDMETIFRATIDRGINLIGLAPVAVEQALASGRPLHGRVHQAGQVLRGDAPSAERRAP